MWYRGPHPRPLPIRNSVQVALTEDVNRSFIEEVVNDQEALVTMEESTPVSSVVGLSETILPLLVPPTSGNSTTIPSLGFGNWIVNSECVSMLDSSDVSKDMVQVSTRALEMGVDILGNVRKRPRTEKGASTTPGWLLPGSGNPSQTTILDLSLFAYLLCEKLCFFIISN